MTFCLLVGGKDLVVRTLSSPQACSANIEHAIFAVKYCVIESVNILQNIFVERAHNMILYYIYLTTCLEMVVSHILYDILVLSWNVERDSVRQLTNCISYRAILAMW